MSDQYLGVGGRMVTVDGKAIRMPQVMGDMQSSVYDPHGKRQDIFAYVDNAIKDVKVTTDATPTQGSTNPVQSGGVYSAINNKLDKTGNGSNVTAAFTAASTRANIATGEKLSVLFGKIAKWFADLGSLAFKSTVAKSDLSSDVQTSLGKADSALQSAPVTSVNGKTGAVTISVPTASTTTPKAPGTAAAGGETTYSRGDHVHPAEVFLATYNETTREEIMAAVEAGKQVFLKTDAAGRTRFALQLASPNAPIMFSRFQLPVDTLASGADNSGWLSFGVVKLGTDDVWSSKPEVYKVPTLPHSRKVTLTASGWNSSTKQQTVTCSGVLSDATKQLLIPTPVNTAAGNPYDEASIQMVAQGANSVTFYAETVPVESIDVYVTILPINYLG